MGNDVRIRVTSSADTKTTRDAVRRDFASMGLQAGNDFSKNLENTVKDRAAQVGDTAGQSFNKGLTRSSKGGAKDVGKDFADSLREGIKGDVVATGKQLGDEFASAFNAGAKNAGKGFAERVYLNARSGLRPAGEELGREFSDSFDGKAENAGRTAGKKVGQNITSEARKEVSATGPLIALGIEAALGPAGGVAGAAVAGGFGLALLGLGAVAASRSQQVVGEFQKLGNTATAEFNQWGHDIQGPVVASLDYIRAQFTKLAPDIGADLKAVAPGFKVLSVGLSDLANGMMPGLNSAAHQLYPTFQGLRSLMGDFGSSIGDMAQMAADHSASIGTDFGHVGNVVKAAVSLVDHLVGELADDFAVHGGELTGAVHSIDSAVTSLGQGAFPMLGSAIGGDLRVISAFFDLLGMGGPALGTFAGALASAATNAKLFGLAEKPLQGLASKLKDAGTEGTTFGTVTTKAGTVLDKFAGALPLVGVGLTVVSTLMEVSAQHAAELAQEGAEAAKGLEMGGSSAASARQQLNQWHQDVANANARLKELNSTQQQSVNIGSVYGRETDKNAASKQAEQNAIDDANAKIKAAMDAYNKYAVAAGLAGMSTDEFTGKIVTYDSTATHATSNTAQLAADMIILGDNTATADQKTKALQDTLALMSDQGLEKADDAIAQFGSTLGTFNDGASKMKGAVFDATGQLNLLSDAGRTVFSAITSSRDSMAAYAQAAADAGVPQDQINDKLGTMAQQLVDTIGPAVGSKGAAEDLLRTYHALPSDITTNVHANTGEAQGVINSFIAMNNGRQIQIYTSVLGAGGLASAGRLATGGVVGSAATGRTVGGSPTWMGEQGVETASYMGHTSVIAAPSLVQAPVGTHVDSAADSARKLAGAMAGGGSAPAEVHLYLDASDDMASQAMLYLLRKAIRTQGGNVQLVLGRG